jgi:hypothetical protein
MHEFKKLTAENFDDENYYSIHYLDKTDGKIHIGFSSFSLDVISDFLKEFFINNNKERHAHWNDNFSFKSNAKRVDICSCCKSAICRDINSDKYNYCPTCGAKMDEEVSNDT